jgi:hypothetical protein
VICMLSNVAGGRSCSGEADGVSQGVFKLCSHPSTFTRPFVVFGGVANRWIFFADWRVWVMKLIMILRSVGIHAFIGGKASRR